jgi:3-oxoacyl-[acyl-carrier-protein] synthase II
MSERIQRRVVVTGVGILSSIGIGKEQFWQGIRSNKCGIGPITLFNAKTFPVRIAGEVVGFDGHDFFPHQVVRRIDRFALLGLVAAKEAVDDSGLAHELRNGSEENVSVIVATSVGALAHAERTHRIFVEKGSRRISPYFNTNVIASSCATQIALSFGIHGDVQTVTTACASGTTAIGEAFHKIRSGQIDVAIAGASESPITPLVLSTFGTVGLLSTDNDSPKTACRPFSRDRNGLAIAEGAGMVILEELEHALARGARIYGEVVGYGSTFDSHHVLHPLPCAQYAARAITRALVDGAVIPEEVEYLNAHGTGTAFNDKTETLAIKRAFGDHAHRMAVSSTKSFIGHTLGAAGALEFVACLMMLENQYIHPTLNLREPDPECDLDYVPLQGRDQDLRTIVSNSTGFGGYNAACVVRKFE